MDVLNKFVSKGELDPDWMKTIVTLDGYDYSTNRYVLCRKKSSSLEDSNVPKGIELREFFNEKKYDNVFTISNPSAVIENIKKMKELVEVKEKIECPVCQGEGDVEWEFEEYCDYFQCPKCYGNCTIEDEGTPKKQPAFNLYTIIKMDSFNYVKPQLLIDVLEVCKGDTIVKLCNEGDKVLIHNKEYEIFIACALTGSTDKKYIHDFESLTN